jgi:hypothetical protein
VPPEKTRCENAGAVRFFFRAQYHRARGNQRSLRRIAARLCKSDMEIDFVSRMQGTGCDGTQASGADIPRNRIELERFSPSFNTANDYRQWIEKPCMLSSFCIHNMPRKV